MKEVSLSNWSRSSHYEVFKNVEKPQFSICTKIDVSKLIKREENFFNLFLYNIMMATNDVPEFKLRIKNGKVYEFDALDINTNLLAENNCFVSRRISYRDSFEAFNKDLQEEKENIPKEGVLHIDKEQEDNVVITSFIPWTHFDSISEPIFSKDESLIKIVYGKYAKVNGKYMIPICVTANHALVDGYHMGDFFKKLSDRC